MRILTQVVLVVLLVGQAATTQAAKPNVLLICVDDLRPELACFGVDYIKSPHIDQLAAAGRTFSALRIGRKKVRDATW